MAVTLVEDASLEECGQKSIERHDLIKKVLKIGQKGIQRKCALALSFENVI